MFHSIESECGEKIVEGQIVTSVSGVYGVLTGDGSRIDCKARGVFRCKGKKIHPLVGDYVQYDTHATNRDGMGVIVAVQPRRNELLRPAVANVDVVLVTASLASPPVHTLTLDRLLVQIEKVGLEVLLIFTKTDLVDEETALIFYNIYDGVGYPVFLLGADRSIRQVIETLSKLLCGRVAVMAGESGVGKSTLLNHLLPDHRLQTGEVSRRRPRGRHTTRTVELFPLPGGGQIADTPGFSQLELEIYHPQDLAECFPEFIWVKEESVCRFRACLHHNEPGCVIQQAVQQGTIVESRYNNYLHMLAGIRPRYKRGR